MVIDRQNTACFRACRKFHSCITSLRFNQRTSNKTGGQIELFWYRVYHLHILHCFKQISGTGILENKDTSLWNVVQNCYELSGFVCFLQRRNARIASVILATAIPSVRPSVTRRYCVKTTHSTVQFALLDSKMCLVL